jgi:hypothetical protein
MLLLCPIQGKAFTDHAHYGMRLHEDSSEETYSSAERPIALLTCDRGFDTET